MNPLVKLRKFFESLVTQGRSTVNAAGPVDQIDGGEKVVAAVKCLKSHVDDAEALQSEFTQEKVAAMLEEAVNAGVTAKVAAGELFTKDDHDAKVAAAKQEVATLKDGEIVALKRTVENDRKIAAELHAKVAARLDDETRGAEDIDPVITELKRRTDQLPTVGLSLDDKDEARAAIALNKVFCAGFDKEGAATFDSEIKGLVALGCRPLKQDKPGTPGSVSASQKPPVGGGAGDPPAQPKKVVAF